MPRYFFDTDLDERLSVDEDGLELDGPEQARTEALRALPDMARDVFPQGQDRTLVTTVRTEDEAVIFRASLTLKCEWLG
jgi:hypothetical protein